ncbi:hypothetical protein ABC761_13530 [Salmonella sp. ZASA478]
MAAGAGLIKAGEAGRGLKSRWYPETLARRIEVLQSMRQKIKFEQADAFKIIRRYSDDDKAFFSLTHLILLAEKSWLAALHS